MNLLVQVEIEGSDYLSRGEGVYTEVRDIMRRDIVSLRDILNEILDSDLR